MNELQTKAANRAALKLDLDAPADTLEDQIVDQIADLMVLADLVGLDVDGLLARADVHYLLDREGRVL